MDELLEVLPIIVYGDSKASKFLDLVAQKVGRLNKLQILRLAGEANVRHEWPKLYWCGKEPPPFTIWVGQVGRSIRTHSKNDFSRIDEVESWFPLALGSGKKFIELVYYDHDVS